MVVGEEDHYYCAQCQQLFCSDCVETNTIEPPQPVDTFVCDNCSNKIDPLKDSCITSRSRLLRGRLEIAIQCIHMEEIEVDGSNTTIEMSQDRRLIIAGQKILNKLHKTSENTESTSCVASCCYLAAEPGAAADEFLLDVLPNSIPLLRNIKEVLNKYADR